MKKSNLQVSIPGPSGPLTLHFLLSVDRRIEQAWSETSADQQSDEILKWLSLWLAGHDMPFAYENVAEAFLAAFPKLPWTWSHIPQEIIRQALYQTHPRVQVEAQDRIVCRCHKVSELTIKKVLAAQPSADVADLGRLIKVGTGCGSCRQDLQQIVEKSRPAARRWHGESFATWAHKAQDSLDRWRERSRFSWVNSKTLTVTAFRDGVVYVKIQEGLTADQEWELTEALSSYWTEGFPEPLELFLDFSLL